MTEDYKITPKIKIKWPPSDDRGELYKWFAFYIMASTLPIYGTMFLVGMFTKDAFSFTEYASSGEFSLLAASLIGSLLTLLAKGSKGMRFPFHGAFSLAAYVLVIFSLLVFVGAVLASRSVDASGEEGTTYLVPGHTSVVVVSVLTYLGALFIMLIALICEQQFEDLSPSLIPTSQATELASDYKNTEVE